MFAMDYIMNGRGYGPVAQTIQGCQFDPGLMRPYFDSRGIRCVTVNTGKRDSKGKPVFERRPISELLNLGISSPVFNATSLRKDDWIEYDRVVVRAARSRLRAWADLAGANTFGGFNGLAKPILEYESMSDPGEAVGDMDVLAEGRNDKPRFNLQGMPLPITHCDFFLSARQLAVSRQSGTPLDTTMAEAAGRRVAEMIEQTTIGTVTGMTYGTSTDYGTTSAVYGYTNYPYRNTKTDLTTPTGANPEAVVQDILEMRDQLYADNFFGPFVLYHSTGYDAFLDNDYFRTGGTSANMTLRQRVEAIDGISAVRRLDYLTSGYVLIMVQMTPDVARAINGMDITTVQWEEKGGMMLKFKVMAIQVPQIRSDFDGRCGIVHATTS